MSDQGKEKVACSATFPGFCHICGWNIQIGEMIVRSQLCGNPVAAHLECEAQLMDKEGKSKCA